MTVFAAKVTPCGVLVPHALIATLGNIREVEIEKRADALVIRPTPSMTAALRGRLLDKMRAAGL